MSHPSGDALYALCLCYEKCVDIIGITFVTILQLFYQYKWQDGPDYAFIAYSALILYCVQTVSHLLSIHLEVLHQIPVLETYNLYPLTSVIPYLAITTFAVCSICGWRGMFLLHGALCRCAEHIV